MGEEFVEFAKEEPPSFLSEREEAGRNLILEKAGIEEKDDLLMVTFRVEAVTFESKVKPADYEGERVYAYLVPVDNREIRVAVYNPAKKVTPETNAGVFGEAAYQVGRMFDGMAVKLAEARQRERNLLLDQEIVERDRAEAGKQKRFNVRDGKEAQPKKDAGEML